jgi:hypothetical protein
MKLTNALKGWLVEHTGLSAEATDEEARKAVTDALFDIKENGEPKLTQEKLLELTKDVAASAFDSKLDLILDGMAQQSERIKTLEASQAPVSTVASSDGSHSNASISSTAPKMPAGDGSTLTSGEPFDKALADGSPVSTDPKASIRQITADERYDKSRYEKRFPDINDRGRKHAFGGQRVFEGGDAGRRYIDEPSELDKATAGAWLKWQLTKGGRSNADMPRQMRLTDHDRELVMYALQKQKWGGVLGGEGSEDDGAVGIKNEFLSPQMQKQVIDEAGGSGGQNIAPIAFDDQVVLIPLLNGEFYPMVNTVNITRGRRMESGSIGNVTLTSGGDQGDNDPIPLFNTNGFVSAFNTNIFVVDGSIEIGLDFLSDSPVDLSGIVTQQYGQQLLTWLDTQVCVGDGTTEPQGIVTNGGTAVASANGAGGPPTVGDYEGLLFAIPKNYKTGTPTNRIAYGGTETSYQRARGIAVGATDQRRVFGMTHEDYMLFAHPYGIGEFFTNAQIIFANFARYRMYRRVGLTVRQTTEGRTLVRNNLMLITARARYGGQLEDANAAGVMTDAQA